MSGRTQRRWSRQTSPEHTEIDGGLGLLESCWTTERRASLCDMPEVLVPVHECSQRGVFELLLSPELRKSVKITRDTGATVPYN
jgi:hypothetical protein